jgi:signal transduction histidine kinase
MRERSEALGGTFKVEAMPGSGVRLTIELPAAGRGSQ